MSRKENNNNRNNKRMKSLPNKISNPCQYFYKNETSFYAPSCEVRGSFTLEAAMVFPFILGFFLTFLFFFRILETEMAVREALSYASRKTACLSVSADNQAVLLVGAEGFFRSALKETLEDEGYVKNGMTGISLLGSDFDGEYVSLTATYFVRLPKILWKWGALPVTQKSCSKKWSGQTVEGTQYVYVTETGEVYHRTKMCQSLNIRVSTVKTAQIGNIRNRNGEKYRRCSECAEKNLCQEWVYVTPYGEAYHLELGCSHLKRTIQRISVDKIEGRRKCAICW